MRIKIMGKNMPITDALRARTEKKVRKLERYFDEYVPVNVTMALEKNRHIVEITIPFAGGVLRGEEATEDMYASLDRVLGKLEKQIHRYRTRLEKKLRTGAFEPDEPEFIESPEKAADQVIRVKRFAIKPMPLDEAMMQMDLLGHSFYVFTNAATGEVNVLYRRHDGNLGLIEPEYE